MGQGPWANGPGPTGPMGQGPWARHFQLLASPFLLGKNWPAATLSLLAEQPPPPQIMSRPDFVLHANACTTARRGSQGSVCRATLEHICLDCPSVTFAHLPLQDEP